MARRRIGQERLGFGGDQAGATSPLNAMANLIDWSGIAHCLSDIYSAANSEPGWPPLALFKALLLATWYDLSDVKLAEALADRVSFRLFAASPPPSRRLSGRPLFGFGRSWFGASWIAVCVR
jgi:IS5 family transposase